MVAEEALRGIIQDKPLHCNGDLLQILETEASKSQITKFGVIFSRRLNSIEDIPVLVNWQPSWISRRHHQYMNYDLIQIDVSPKYPVIDTLTTNLE